MRGTLRRLYAVQTDFNFRKAWRVMLIVFGILMIISIASLAINGLNLSIDFRGGAVWEVPSRAAQYAMTPGEANSVLAKFNKENGAKVQTVTDANGRRITRVQAESAKNVAQSQDIADALAKKANENVPKKYQIAT